MRAWIAILVMLLSLPVWAAQDGNEGLYEMAAPPDSAFIRVVNITDGQVAVEMDDWRQSLSPRQAGDYLYRPVGKAQISVAGKPFAFEFEARSVQTLVFDGASLVKHEDIYFNNRLKALLVMYNLSDQSASLQTLNGAVNVIGPLLAGNSGEREINGVKVALKVALDSGSELPLEEVVLQRGRIYTVLVTPGSGGVQAHLEESHVATTP
ncbi:alginate O-acetyltransferase AlgF [Alcanivorax sp. DP30]|uniref:alginate O-acetyltransferase AlgF n=1 Tax=Alcanivorax sp. DP30 TaxID=2606217 RepID=UPI0013708CA7|nr:alginate O-acetyltransferase AlgF [Alcanivorax sp. DP30]MZR61274.1 alginate O-acetyltransferase AlgF [Alcanivorax sp. DP30]